jgi:hypothetical protein
VDTVGRPDNVFITKIGKCATILAAKVRMIQGYLSAAGTSFPNAHEPNHVEAKDFSVELGRGDIGERNATAVSSG